jgi:hypothetical protein
MGETKAEKLTIHITGETAPELMGAGDLAELLQSLEQSVMPIVQRDSPQIPAESKLALVSIGAGSINLGFSYPAAYSKAFTLLGAKIDSGDISDLPERSRRGVIGLGKWCRARSLSLDMNIGASKIASVTPELELRFETAPRILGTTELFGKVHSVVGGEKPSFKLRLTAGDLLSCSCGEDLARHAGRYLYRKVKVEGRAANNIATGEICAFEATAIALAEHKVSEAFEDIRKEYGSVFDALNVDEFMKQVRGD